MSVEVTGSLHGSVELVFGLDPEMRDLYRSSLVFQQALDEVVECFALAAQLPDDEYAQFLRWVVAHSGEMR